MSVARIHDRVQTRQCRMPRRRDRWQLKQPLSRALLRFSTSQTDFRCLTAWGGVRPQLTSGLRLRRHVRVGSLLLARNRLASANSRSICEPFFETVHKFGVVQAPCRDAGAVNNPALGGNAGVGIHAEMLIVAPVSLTHLVGELSASLPSINVPSRA